MLCAALQHATGQVAATQPEGLEDALRLSEQVAKLYGEGKYEAALPLAGRVLGIREKALGPHHPGVATSLNKLGALYRAKGDYTRAEPLYHRALAIREKALGPDHADVATSLNNLAGLYRAKGEYGRAEPLYERALAIREKALGPEHLEVAISLNNLARLYETMGDYARAVQFQSRGNEVQERTLALILSTGSERQKLAYLATQSDLPPLPEYDEWRPEERVRVPRVMQHGELRPPERLRLRHPGGQLTIKGHHHVSRRSVVHTPE